MTTQFPGLNMSGPFFRQIFGATTILSLLLFSQAPHHPKLLFDITW
jgi:hypothetical protein